jgi:hypothetical protein
MSETRFDSFITAVQLGPSFLENEHPKLVAVCFGEAWFSKLAGEVVVDDHFLCLAIFLYNDCIKTVFVCSVGDEQLLYSLRNFCKSTENGEEVAVSEQALLDVRWGDIILENSKFALVIV